MAQKYKIKITKAYHIAIEDKDGYEVASDWSFFDYKETKKQAEKMLAEWNRIENVKVVGENLIEITLTDGKTAFHKIIDDGRNKDVLIRYATVEEWRSMRKSAEESDVQ